MGSTLQPPPPPLPTHPPTHPPIHSCLQFGLVSWSAEAVSQATYRKGTQRKRERKREKERERGKKKKKKKQTAKIPKGLNVAVPWPENTITPSPPGQFFSPNLCDFVGIVPKVGQGGGGREGGVLNRVGSGGDKG